MYNYIFDPQTNKIHNITTKIGKKILYNYLSILYGSGGKSKKDQSLPLQQQPVERSNLANTEPNEEHEATYSGEAESADAASIRDTLSDETSTDDLPIKYHENLQPKSIDIIFDKLRSETKLPGHYYLQLLSPEERKIRGITQKQFEDIHNGTVYLYELFSSSPNQLEEFTKQIIVSSVYSNIGNKLINHFERLYNFEGHIKSIDMEIKWDIFFFTELTKYYFEKSTPKSIIEKLFSLQNELIVIYLDLNYDEHLTDIYRILLEEIIRNKDEEIIKIIVTMKALFYILQYDINHNYDAVLEAYEQYIFDDSIPLRSQLIRAELPYSSPVDLKELISMSKYFEDFFESLEGRKIELEDLITKLRSLKSEDKLVKELIEASAKAERIGKELVDEDERVKKEKAETQRIKKEKAEANRIRKEEAEAERLSKEAEAERVSKKAQEEEATRIKKAEAMVRAAKILDNEKHLQEILESLNKIQLTVDNLSASSNQEYDRFESLISEMKAWPKDDFITNAIKQAIHHYNEAYQILNTELKSEAEQTIDNIMNERVKGIDTDGIKQIDMSSIYERLDIFNQAQLAKLKTDNTKILHNLIIEARQILVNRLRITEELKQQNLESPKIITLLAEIEESENWLSEKEEFGVNPFILITQDSHVRNVSLDCIHFQGKNPHELITKIYDNNPIKNIVILDCANFLSSKNDKLEEYKRKYSGWRAAHPLVANPSAFYVVIKEDSLHFFYQDSRVEDMFSNINRRIRDDLCTNERPLNIILVVIHVDKCSFKHKEKKNCLKSHGLHTKLDSFGKPIRNRKSGKYESETICELFDSVGNSFKNPNHVACGYDDMFARGMTEWTEQHFTIMQPERQLLTGETKGGLAEEQPHSMAQEIFENYFRGAELDFKICIYKQISIDQMAVTNVELPSKIFK